MRHPNSYEYVGLPCSGKTTASTQLSDSLDENTRVCHFSWLFGSHTGRLQRYIFRFQCLFFTCAAEPTKSFRLIGHLRASQQRSVKTFFALLVQYCCYRYSVRRANRYYNCYIADEGMLHFIWAVSLDSKEKCTEIFRRFEFLVPITDVQHRHMSIDHDEMIKRLDKRSGNSRFERRPDLRRAGVHNMEELSKFAMNITDINFIVQSGNDGAEHK